MKANLVSIGAIVAFACAATAQAQPAAVAGSWAAKVPTPNGQRSLDVVFTFTIEGSKLAGTATAGGATYDLVDTRLDGDNIAFAVEGESARYAGTVAGDEIKMRVTFKSGENGTRTWTFTAKRLSARDRGAPSIEGEWTGEVPRGGRFIAATFVFHVDGSILAGHVHALDDDFPIVRGRIDGSTLAFNVGDTIGDYTGEWTGDTIKMKVKYTGGEAGRQTLGFTLTRAKP